MVINSCGLILVVDTSCTVGTFSETGYEPCEQCSTGSYAVRDLIDWLILYTLIFIISAILLSVPFLFQDADGSTSCTGCEEGETTLTSGSSSEFDCYGLYCHQQCYSRYLHNHIYKYITKQMKSRNLFYSTRSRSI